MLRWGENLWKFEALSGDLPQRWTEARLDSKARPLRSRRWPLGWPSSLTMLGDIWLGSLSIVPQCFWDSAGWSKPRRFLTDSGYSRTAPWGPGSQQPLWGGRAKVGSFGPFFGKSFMIRLSALCSTVSFLPRKQPLWITGCVETGLLKMSR